MKSTTDNIDEAFSDCLYFTANALSRCISKMADEAFMQTGLSPSYAFLMMIVCRKQSVTIGEAARILRLDSSTVTRFVDKLVAKNYLMKKSQGRSTQVTATKEGMALLPLIETSWDTFHVNYEQVLGETIATEIVAGIAEANRILYED